MYHIHNEGSQRLGYNHFYKSDKKLKQYALLLKYISYIHFDKTIKKLKIQFKAFPHQVLCQDPGRNFIPVCQKDLYEIM